MKDTREHQLWGCDNCTQTYRSPIRLSVPPTHHCGGSSLAAKNLPMKLRKQIEEAMADGRQPA